MNRPYPSYRQAGVQWLEDIPEHWEVGRLGHAAHYRTSSVDKKTVDGELPIRLCNYTDVYYNELISAADGPFMKATASEREIERFRLAVGDVVITKDSEDWRDIGVPALIENSAADFVCGYHLGIIRSGLSVKPGYVFRLMQSAAVNEQLQVSASGVTRYGLPKAAVNEALIPLPPLGEQKAIAESLDRETSKVDALIAKNRVLIERLDEYRTALISRTVTRGLPPDAARSAGLNPSPRLKLSDMGWLGRLPEHWELETLGRMGSFFKGGGGTKQDEADDGLPCVRYGDLYTWHQFLIRDTRTRIKEEATSRYRKLRYGDVLFAGSGETLDEIGKSAVNLIRGPVYCGGDVIVFRSSIEIDATFLGYATDSLTAVYQKACMGKGVTIMHIYAGQLRQMAIPLPPLEEQRAISEFLNRETERIDALVTKVEVAIERLLEYRAALISAAVTGKIDVRDSIAAGVGGEVG